MAQTSPINNPTAYTNTSNPQTIYITVRDTDNDCTAETTLVLRVEIPPVLVNPDPLELCDVTEIFGPDDQTRSSTSPRPSRITGGALGVSVTFFESLSDMQMGTDAISPATAYQNTVNNQTILDTCRGHQQRLRGGQRYGYVGPYSQSAPIACRTGSVGGVRYRQRWFRPVRPDGQGRGDSGWRARCGRDLPRDTARCPERYFRPYGSLSEYRVGCPDGICTGDV